MRLGKAILAKPQDLLKNLSRELFLVAAFAHAVDQLVLERTKATPALPCSHCTAQAISFAWCKAGSNHCQLHDLFLENRDTQRALQHTLNLIARIIDGLLAISSPQVRMHHVTLDRARADDCHLDYKVVITTRPKPRQHRHLCTRLDLEYAHRITVTNHVVDLRILGWNVGQRVPATIKFTDQIETPAYCGQHAKT